ncbi:GntR family transcriptional regulator [Paracoccus cavernae]|uniref:GntR family transcriptional regulator n=1 Tax=Paracoccus cavernae TaxID=1571207 RepID=A0ABT8DAC0_9RHOB|nr:GntR family transcriptional regulator [Paracoccus cavernae]
MENISTATELFRIIWRVSPAFRTRCDSQKPIPATSKAQNIVSEVRRRIVDREWEQGDRIPDEAELAIEFGVARATVNKALQLLAEEGLLDRSAARAPMSPSTRCARPRCRSRSCASRSSNRARPIATASSPNA